MAEEPGPGIEIVQQLEDLIPLFGEGKPVVLNAEQLQAVLTELKRLQRLERRLDDMLPLFTEARDALPAISLASAKLRGLDLSLADRMDRVGVAEEWRAMDEARQSEKLRAESQS